MNHVQLQPATALPLFRLHTFDARGVGPPHVVLPGRVQPLDKSVLVRPPHSFALDAANIDQWPAELREFSDRGRVIYRSARLSLHASNHPLNIFRGAGLNDEDKYRTHVRIAVWV